MKPILYLIICLALLGCNKSAPSEASKVVSSDMVLAPPPVSELNDKESDQQIIATGKITPSANVSEQKIIKEGELTFETADLTSTRKRIDAELRKTGGYVESESQLSSQYSSKTIKIAVRIPAKNFDLFLKNVSAKDNQIIEKNIRLTDVTTQYIDSKTRLENRKLLEKRFLQLLQKAAKVGDVLEIENKLAEIRSDIESQQGQLNYLLKQVQYSSLSITFFVKGVSETEPGFAYRFRQSFSESIEVLSDLFFGIIRYWPVIVLCLLAVFGLKKYRNRNGLKTKS